MKTNQKKTTTQDDDNPNLLNTKINLQALDSVDFVHYWEEKPYPPYENATWFYLVARQKCNDDKYIYLSLAAFICHDDEFDGKTVLSEKAGSFLKQLNLHSCKIKQICTYMEKNENVKIELRNLDDTFLD